MGSFFTLTGRLHPLLVHLPIGILLLAVLLEVMSARERYRALKPAADLSLLIGFLCAVVSCITGLLLSQSGDYDESVVNVHQWLAISLTGVSGFLYVTLHGKPMTRQAGAATAGVVVLLFLTGHWGGTLTHGPGYLTANLEPAAFAPALQPVADVQGAGVYTNLVQPVLHDNCYGCHRAGRVKGGLRLDLPDGIVKGGKDGAVIVAGQAAASLLIKRVLLPVDDDHHMAPKDKPQLTIREVQLLKWWIDNGAPFDKPVRALRQDTSVAAMLLAFHNGTAAPVAASLVTNVADSDLPMGQVGPAPAEAVKVLRAAGAVVLPIDQASNYLSVDLAGKPVSKEVLRAIPMLKDQLVSLKGSFSPAGDELVSAAAACPHLVRLWLDHTAVTGANLDALRTLPNLKYLNLTGDKVGAAQVAGLKGAPKLAEIYLYQTNVGRGDWDSLRRDFPGAVLDSGGYGIPFLVTDTAIVREPAKKN
ncbi:MAG TPA: c-type cytochrome domain-containing protein [Puia sp.]|nr:c-type cytochrome domain-containing protein [Puia sp.]